jgi:hypothetical protein
MRYSLVPVVPVWHSGGMDHRQLLRKYIDHVGHCEDNTFLSDWYRELSDGMFTDDEWAELTRIDQAASQEAGT